MTSQNDIHYMRYALTLARRGLGRTAPNPTVGCVIVKHDRIIGVGRTADGGRPHAETIALDMAGKQAKGATAYVTLEPCSHHGKTPPCAQALIDAGIKRVVIACKDQNPEVSDNGVNMLKDSGIDVVENILSEDAEYLNAGFFLSMNDGRPFVTLKTAMTLDGKIALSDGSSKWITNSLSRSKAHQLRSQHDAILCGIGTVNADDPMLNVRVDGLVHKAVRIVLDTELSIDVNSKLVQFACDEPLWIIHDAAGKCKKDALEGRGVKLFHCNPKDLKAVLQILAENGLTRVLVEGGASIHSAFLKSGLYDELAVFRAAKIFGQGRGVFTDFSIPSVDEALQLEPLETILLGQDSLQIYKKKIV